MLRTWKTFITVLLAGSASAQETPVALQLQQVAANLPHITEVTHCGDGRLFLVLQAGVIRIRDASGTVIGTPFLDITDRVYSDHEEQGLLGLAFDPDYTNNGYFYVDYIGGDGAGTSRISRFSVTANPNVADPASEEILYTVDQPAYNHNGGGIHFGPDGMLYISFGDGGNANDPWNNAQMMSTPLGKILRIDVSGPGGWTAPSDNPFVGVSGALPEIWALGLRNPWRWGFDRQTGDVWIGDVGQNAWEEVNFWPAGDNSGPNFGWRCREGLVVCPTSNTSGCQSGSNYVNPVSVHENTYTGGDWCASIGGRVYRGNTYWRIAGRYIHSDYCSGDFYSLKQDAFGAWVSSLLLSTDTYGFACIGENAAGELFVGDHEAGILYRITETCTAQPPVLTPDGIVLSSSDALDYQWYLEGALMPNETGQSIVPPVSGNYYVLATVNTGCVLASETTFFNMQGLEEGDATNLVIRPNPANDLLWVESDLPVGGRVQLMDAQGRVVVDHRTSVTGPTSVALNEIANGTYVVRVARRDGSLIGQRTITVRH